MIFEYVGYSWRQCFQIVANILSVFQGTKEQLLTLVNS